MFVPSVVSTDEPTLGKDGKTNLHNQHFRAKRNAHGKIQTRYQHQFMINVFSRIVGDFIKSICSAITSYRSCLQGDYFEQTSKPVTGYTTANTQTNVVHA